MKKLFGYFYLTTLCLVLFCLKTNSQNQYNVYSSIAGPYFINGISVNNTFSVSTNDPSITLIRIYLKSSSSVDSSSDINTNSGSWNHDMGNLSANQYTLAARFFDSNGYLINEVSSNVFTILSKPNWMNSNSGLTGSINSVISNNNILTMEGNFDLQATNEDIPSSIPGLNGRSFNIDPKLTFTVNFDCGTKSSTVVTTPELVTDINVLDQYSYTHTFPMSNASIQLGFDGDFNPTASIVGSYSVNLIKAKWPLFSYRIPSAPFVKLKVNGSLTLSAEMKGKLQCGTSSGNWSLDTISGSIKATGEGILTVGLDALVAEIEGKLIGTGTIGAGGIYSTQNNSLTPYFGGSIGVTGEISYRIGAPKLLGLGKEGEFSGTIFNKQFGDNLSLPPFAKTIYQSRDNFGNYYQLLQTNPILNTPDFFASPHLNAKDTNLYVVWLDTNQSNQTVLYLSKYNFSNNSFATPMVVTSYDGGLSNPKVCVMPGGDALISWVQTRYHSSNFDTTKTITDVFESQDIWVSYYNKNTNTLSAPQMLNDDTTNDESGRAEGNQNIFWGKGNKGIITWISADDQMSNSDPYYAIIEKSSNALTITTPDYLHNLSGKSKSINISFIDSLHAIALWIHDIDGFDSTLNNEIMISSIDLSQATPVWSSPSTILSYTNYSNPIDFNTISMDFNENYGGLAISFTSYSQDTSKFVNGILATYYVPSQGQFATWSYDTSSVYQFIDPVINVNDSGIVALLYQTISVFDDVNSPDLGNLNLYVVDSKKQNSTWTTFNNISYLNDPSTYVWDITSSYGKTNDFFVITHEVDNVTGHAPLNPNNGIRFANNHLDLVLRKISVSTSTVVDVPEPQTNLTINPFYFDIKVFPNPSNGNFVIDFDVIESETLLIELLDITGKNVLTLFNSKISPGHFQLKSNIISLENGIYLCKVQLGNKVSTRKIIIQK